MKYAKIIIDISAGQADRAFTYRIPETLEDTARIGLRVMVPFGTGKRLRKGIIIGLSDQCDYDEHKIKEIVSSVPGAVDGEADLIRLAEIIADEYGCTMNQALKTVLPVRSSVRKNSRRKDPVETILSFSQEGEKNNLRADSAEHKQEGSRVSISPEEQQEKSRRSAPVLNEDQRRVCTEILSDMRRTSLLYGITGSGKTRVYIELIRQMQREGKSSIVLIPEISLAYQMITELTGYFGDRIAVLHSRLSAGERYDQYVRALRGDIDVMVGPRSALFAPFANTGLIIIDEEHEHTYQSETAPRYDARFVAERKAAMCGAKLLLGSATPSLGSYKKALSGEYMLHVLKKRAHAGASLPSIHVADMRKELMNGNRSIFSVQLREMINDRLSRGEQIMLFLNRRGYAGFVSCRSCGRVIKCPHCDVSLTAHNEWYRDPATGRKMSALLSCHYCGYTSSMPDSCPECGSRFIAPFGTGTQKLEQACRREFPGVRVLRMDGDTTSEKNSFERILSSFRAHEADILIGTQMIVKGHDFENVTLVGIVAADMSINSPEYDASERTYQLITQAAGRSGRGSRPGDVVIQSYDPSHYAISCAAGRDYEAFFEREMSYRRLMGYPPELYMLFIRLRSEDEAALDEACGETVKRLGETVGNREAVIGPCRESVYKIKDSYRKIIYVKDMRHDIIKRIRDDINEQVALRYSREHVYFSFDIR
ncbi:MAG: primosomal protein N' [Clostridiales bacterium]|nr:primosomal protein N' [Clostridiales bacterium]